MIWDVKLYVGGKQKRPNVHIDDIINDLDQAIDKV